MQHPVDHPSEQVDRSAYSSASLWSRVTFGWSVDLVREANKRELKQGDACYLMPTSEKACKASMEFDEAYGRLKVRCCRAMGLSGCL